MTILFGLLSLYLCGAVITAWVAYAASCRGAITFDRDSAPEFTDLYEHSPLAFCLLAGACWPLVLLVLRRGNR